MKLRFGQLKLATVSRIVAIIAVSTLVTSGFAQAKRKVATWPWQYEKGTDTARKTAERTLVELPPGRSFDVIDMATAKKAFNKLSPGVALRNGIPVEADLKRFARAVGADVVLVGSISWHTRSIWVNLGPKTISTASVDGYVFDAKTGKYTYTKSAEGRSDEKSDTLKVIGAVLLTPLITAVSGGPATPMEQRAVQIALARVYGNWVNGKPADK